MTSQHVREYTTFCDEFHNRTVVSQNPFRAAPAHRAPRRQKSVTWRHGLKLSCSYQMAHRGLQEVSNNGPLLASYIGVRPSWRD
jgi:hypothetical protein